MQTKKYFIEKNVAHAQFRKCSPFDPNIYPRLFLQHAKGETAFVAEIEQNVSEKKESETNNLEDVCFSYTRP